MERLPFGGRLARTGWILGGRFPRGFFRGRTLREWLPNGTRKGRIIGLANRLRATGDFFQIHADGRCKEQAAGLRRAPQPIRVHRAFTLNREL